MVLDFVSTTGLCNIVSLIINLFFNPVFLINENNARASTLNSSDNKVRTINLF